MEPYINILRHTNPRRHFSCAIWWHFLLFVNLRALEFIVIARDNAYLLQVEMHSTVCIAIFLTGQRRRVWRAQRIYYIWIWIQHSAGGCADGRQLGRRRIRRRARTHRRSLGSTCTICFYLLLIPFIPSRPLHSSGFLLLVTPLHVTNNCMYLFVTGRDKHNVSKLHNNYWNYCLLFRFSPFCFFFYIRIYEMYINDCALT